MKENGSLLRVISYNIHSGKDLLMRPQLENIISFLNDENPHVIGVQEINENNKRGYQFSKIKNGLKMDGSFAPNVKIGKGYYGVALFTSLKVVNTNHILLPSTKEQRGLLHMTIEIGDKKLELLNTHLGLSKSERKIQFEFIENYIKGINTPYILMGDLNTTNPDLKGNDMIDTAGLLDKEHISTFIGLNKRIDYVLIYKSVKVVSYQVVPIRYSDHYPIVVEILF